MQKRLAQLFNLRRGELAPVLVAGGLSEFLCVRLFLDLSLSAARG